MWISPVVRIAALLSVVLQHASSLPRPPGFFPLRFLEKGGSIKSQSDFDLKKIFGTNPEVNMDTTELISSKGYPVQSHKVITEDGYVLGVFRIPHGLHNKDLKGTRPVVLLQHGVMGSGDDFLLNLPNQSLPFILADAGADVWIGNSRGNIYSRNHISLSPKDSAFWKFSWDQMAEHDLPATINYVLNQTRQDQLYYVGHSQGTTIAFAKFGEDPKLASRVKHFMALAPVGRVKNMKSPIRFLAPFATGLEAFLDVFGHGEFNMPRSIQRIFAGTLCEKWGEVICENMLFLTWGFNDHSFNRSRTDVYVAHTPAGTSSRTLLHWAQCFKSGQFQRFDFGEKENLVKYGQKTPPLYNPRNVNVPVASFRGGNDWLADSKDVSWLLPQLNVTHDINIPFYQHMDMVMAIDVNVLMYTDLVKIVMSGQ